MHPGASRAGEFEMMAMNLDEFLFRLFPFQADHVSY